MTFGAYTAYFIRCNRCDHGVCNRDGVLMCTGCGSTYRLVREQPPEESSEREARR